MADSGLTYQHNIPSIARVLAARQRRHANLQPFFASTGETIVRRWFARQFATNGAVSGQRWQPLSPVTLALKAKRGRAKMGILRDSNRLWASLTKRGAPESVVAATRDSLTVGTTVRQPGPGPAYAALHQRGYSITSMFGRRLTRKRRVPARPIVPDTLPEIWKTEMARGLAKYLDGGGDAV